MKSELVKYFTNEHYQAVEGPLKAQAILLRVSIFLDVVLIQSLDLDSLKRTSLHVEKISTCWENLNSSKSKPKILINLNFRQGLYLDLNLDKNKTNICCDIYTVRPVLTATSEQRPPVYSGQLEPQFSKILFL